jgi:hypothetical protein
VLINNIDANIEKDRRGNVNAVIKKDQPVTVKKLALTNDR